MNNVLLAQLTASIPKCDIDIFTEGFKTTRMALNTVNQRLMNHSAFEDLGMIADTQKSISNHFKSLINQRTILN